MPLYLNGKRLGVAFLNGKGLKFAYLNGKRVFSKGGSPTDPLAISYGGENPLYAFWDGNEFWSAYVMVDVSGGVAPYTFQWESEGGFLYVEDEHAQTTRFYCDLDDDAVEVSYWRCTVTDAEGSTATTDAIDVRTQPASVRLTPPMTSNTTPGPWVVSAASQWSGQSPPFIVLSQTQLVSGFDANYATGGNTFNSSTGLANSSQWVQIYTGGEFKQLAGIRLRSLGANIQYITQSPIGFSLTVSDDGNNWAEVFTENAATMPTTLYQVYYSRNFTPVSFKYLRLNLLRIGTGNSNCSFGELELYGA